MGKNSRGYRLAATPTVWIRSEKRQEEEVDVFEETGQAGRGVWCLFKVEKETRRYFNEGASLW